MYGKEVTLLKSNVKTSPNANIKKYSLTKSDLILQNNQENYKYYVNYIIIPLTDLYLYDADAPSEISDVLFPACGEVAPEVGDKVQWYSLDRLFEYYIQKAPQSLEDQFYSVNLTLVRSSKSILPTSYSYERKTVEGTNRIIDPTEENRISVIKFKE